MTHQELTSRARRAVCDNRGSSVVEAPVQAVDSLPDDLLTIDSLPDDLLTILIDCQNSPYYKIRGFACRLRTRYMCKLYPTDEQVSVDLPRILESAGERYVDVVLGNGERTVVSKDELRWHEQVEDYWFAFTEGNGYMLASELRYRGYPACHTSAKYVEVGPIHW